MTAFRIINKLADQKLWSADHNLLTRHRENPVLREKEYARRKITRLAIARNRIEALTAQLRPQMNADKQRLIAEEAEIFRHFFAWVKEMEKYPPKVATCFEQIYEAFAELEERFASNYYDQ